MRCLAKDPAERLVSARELVDVLSSSSALVPDALGGAPVSADQRTRTPVPADPAVPSLAVLPMVNTSGDPENEHFSDGLTDELIGALSKIASLRVTGRTSSFALKGQGLDIRAVAARLGVGAVLEGSVRRAGTRLKAGVQLVDADGSVRWSESYDRTLTDLFAVQEEIAQAVVGALRVQLGVTHGPLAQAGTANLTAYDLYLKGRFVRRRFNPDDLRRAIGYFEQAVALDPAYARAYAALSDAHTLLAVFAGRPALEELPVARAHAQRAVALGGMLADAHFAVAHVAFALELDFATAGREMEHALALDPGHVDARHTYAIWLLDHRRLDAAAAELTRALAADPLLADARMTLGRVYLLMGLVDRAVASIHAALELAPAFAYAHEQLGHALLRQGRSDEAVAAFERAAATGGARGAAARAYGYAATGRRAEALAILDALLSPEAEAYAPPFHVAMAYAGLRDADAAFHWLERAFQEHDAHVTTLDVAPPLAALYADPRFAAFRRRLGLLPSP